MLIPNNPDIDFDALNEKIRAHIEQEPVTPEAIPLQHLMTLEDLSFVEQAYVNFLRRRPSPAEAQDMLTKLQRGESKASLLAEVLLTPEFIKSGQPILSRRLRLHRLLKRFRLLRIMSEYVLTLLRLPQLNKRINALQNLLYRQQVEYRSSLQNLEADYLNLQDQLSTLGHHLEAVREETEKHREACQSLEQKQNAAARQTQSNNSRIKALELNTQAAVHGSTPDALPIASSHVEPFDTSFYLAFEDRFRGTTDTIKERLRNYLPLLRQHSLLSADDHRIVDLGCGRGEWLNLLREEGYHAEGVEMSPVNTALCQESGLNVTTADAIEWLQQQPDQSLSCISSFHMIEHLPFQQFRKLMEESWRTLQPGGLLILETPNPENLITGTTHFYTDPTHLRPVPPALSEFLAEYTGFSECEIRRLHPVEQSLHIQETSETAGRCNHLFYAAQDYALIAIKPDNHDHAH